MTDPISFEQAANDRGLYRDENSRLIPIKPVETDYIEITEDQARAILNASIFDLDYEDDDK